MAHERRSRPRGDGSKLTRFQADLLRAAAARETPNGQDLSRQLADEYTMNPSRLYTNLDELVDAGLLARDEIDGRTNSFTLTDDGRAWLRMRHRQFADVLDHDHGHEPAGVNQPAEADAGASSDTGSDTDAEDDAEPDGEREVATDVDEAIVDAVAEAPDDTADAGALDDTAAIEAALPASATVQDVHAVVDDVRYLHEVADAFDLSSGKARAILLTLGRYGDVLEGRDYTGGDASV